VTTTYILPGRGGDWQKTVSADYGAHTEKRKRGKALRAVLFAARKKRVSLSWSRKETDKRKNAPRDDRKQTWPWRREGEESYTMGRIKKGGGKIEA